MNIYIAKIQEISNQSKYTRWYIQIVTKGLQRASSKKQANAILGYSEGHHILPKCLKMGGEKDKLNIVHLSAREHFIVHLLMPKIFLNKHFSYLLCSANMFMMGKQNYRNSRSFETAKKIQSKYQKYKTNAQKTLKTHYFLNEFNEKIVVKNLKEFCKTNGLNYGTMVNVSRITYKKHKGYKNINYVEPKEEIFEFFTPQGKRMSMNYEQLKKYCSETNIHFPRMKELCRNRIQKYLGHRNTIDYKIYEFISPTGEELKIFDLSYFCQQNELKFAMMNYVYIGKKKYYKGYTKKDPVFVHKENTGRIKKGIVCCFDILEQQFKRISKEEFEKLKNIRYIGQTGKAALEFKHKYNNTQL